MYASRHRGGVDDINAHLGVEGLCKSFPKRLVLVIEAQGGRIHKWAVEVAGRTAQAVPPLERPKSKMSTSTYPCLTQTGVSPRLTVSLS